MARDKNLTSIAGEYYVLAELARRGAVASMTVGHTKGIDILVVAPNGKRMFKAEVKTTYNKPAPKRIFHRDGGKCIEWVMNVKHETIREKDLVFVFVWLPTSPEEHPRIFLAPCNQVARYVTWEHDHWLKERRGQDTDRRTYRIPENKWNLFEDNWKLLGITS